MNISVIIEQYIGYPFKFDERSSEEELSSILTSKKLELALSFIKKFNTGFWSELLKNASYVLRHDILLRTLKKRLQEDAKIKNRI